MTSRHYLTVSGLVTVVSAATGLAASSPSTQQAAFRSTTEVVVVDVLVTRNGRPVEGLITSDFQVRDSGVRQDVALLTVDAVPVDLRLVLDVSASLLGRGLEQLKAASRAAVASLRPNDRAELMTFSDDLRVRAAWTSDRAVLNAEIDKATAAGWTSLVDATFTAFSLPDDPQRRTLLLVFTDGQDTSSWLSPADVLRSAAQSRAIVYGVTTAPVGSGQTGQNAPVRWRQWLLSDPVSVRSAFLPVIVRDSGGELLYATDTADLRSAFLEVVSRFNRRYLLSYTPTRVPNQGWHPIDVQLKDRTLQVAARRGYSR